MSTLAHLRSWLLFASLPLIAAQVRADVAKANEVFQAGRADDATHLVEASLSGDPNDARAHLLLCRIDYSQDLTDEAVRECEKAVALEPGNSDNQLWLARAYGMRAAHANMLTAFGLAKRVRAGFEEAVRLNPRNVAALSDLGEFYVAAPSVVGGGLDKAAELAVRIQAVAPGKAHRLLALVAEKNGDFALAEAEFKQAVNISKSPEATVDLGHFYARRKRFDESEGTLRLAVKLDRAHDQVLVDAASILASAHRQEGFAEELLREYLSSGSKSEDAPACKVHVQLGKLLASDGDPEAARLEFIAALGLASNYPAAKRALASLPAQNPRNSKD